MIAIGELLNAQSSRLPIDRSVADAPFVHLANPKRRGLLRAIGYDEVSERKLRMSYGPSWGAVQSDLRALLAAGLVLSHGAGRRVTYSLDLSAFSAEMLEGVLGKRRWYVGTPARALAA